MTLRADANREWNTPSQYGLNPNIVSAWARCWVSVGGMRAIHRSVALEYYRMRSTGVLSHGTAMN